MRRKRKIKQFLFLGMILLGFFFSYRLLQFSSRVIISDKELIHFIVQNSVSPSKNNIFDYVVEKTVEWGDPIRLMNEDYQKYVKQVVKEEVMTEETQPLIYLYNSHPTEEYAPSDFVEFSVHPTVIMNNYILEDILEKKGYSTIVEEGSISEILKRNHWNYNNSYRASRILLEQSILNYPSLKYFIDIHRDSLKKEKTTVEIEGKKYAKLLFIVGLENENYSQNQAFTESIHQKLEELYPGLSKGIYQKGGPGVNGVYNQDFSPYTILLEVGGYENTTNEVLNSILAFSHCFMEVIDE